MKLIPFDGELDPVPKGTALFTGELDESPTASWGTAFKQKLAEAGNLADAAISLPAGWLAGIHSQEERDRVFSEYEARKARNLQGANPEKLPLTTAQQIGGTLLTSPAQILGMFGGPAEKGMDLIQKGEGLDTAIPATLGETALNAAGVGPMQAAKSVLGRAAIGAGSNVAFGAGSDSMTQLLAKQQATKDAYDPYNLERRFVEAVTGGALQGAFGERPPKGSRLDKIRAESAAKEQAVVKSTEADANFDKGSWEQGNLFPDDGTGYATPYDAGQIGTSSPVTPKRSRAQMELPLRNDLPDTINIDEAGVSLRPEDMPYVNREKNAELARLDEAERLRSQQDFLENAKQQEMWATDHPGDLAKNGEMLPPKRELPPELTKQEDMFAKEPFDLAPDGQMPLFKREDIPVLKDQAQLFEPQTNMHRPYTDMRVDDGKGGERPLTRTEFEATLKNLAEQEGTRAEFPTTKKDLDAAFERYKFATSEKQGGLFDVGSRQERTGMRPFTETKNPYGRDVINMNMGPSLDIDSLKRIFKGEDLDNALLRSEAMGMLPADPTPTELSSIIAETVKTQKPGKQWNNLQSGVTSVAMKTNDKVIQAYGRIMQGAGKVYELSIRHFVFPAEQTLKRLALPDLVELSALFRDEAMQGKRYDPEILAKHLSIKQLEAYVTQRKMLDDVIEIQNSARRARGLPEVTPMEAYLSYRYKGDFRRPVYEKTDTGKKLVWYIAGNSKLSVEAQTKALLKDNPSLIVDPKLDHQVRSSASKSDLDSTYTKLLDVLGRDDPAVKRIAELVAERAIFESEQVMGQPKHFESKAGIRGFVGDRPGLGIEIAGHTFAKKPNPSKEALAMFQEQIQYAKNGYKWSSMQDATDKVKPILSSTEYKAALPNNYNYIRDHFKNSIGMSEGKIARQLDDALRDGLGVSPTILRNAIGDVKSFFILQKLGANLAYSSISILQTLNVLPYLATLRSHGYKGNPVSAVASAMLAGPIMALNHYTMGNSRGIMDAALKGTPELKFYNDAISYAEANSVTSRSVADESPIRASHSILGRTGLLLAKGMTMPETLSRSMAFMAYAEMLRSSGKYTDNTKLFQAAEEHVNKSMVDYRAEERPLIFAKLGAVGDAFNTLQTYPMSFINQYSYMLKETSRGNPAGLAVMLGTHALIGGAMGLPYMEDMDKLFKFLRDNALTTEKWNEVMKSPALSDPKMWVVEQAGKSALWGALSEKTGLGITSRVAAPTASGMLQAPGGPIVDLGKQAINWGKAIADPTDTGKWAQATLGTVPTGVQGVLENLDLMKDYTFVDRPDGKGSTVILKKNLADRKGAYVRKPEEVTMRKFGFRSQKEVVEKEMTYSAANQLQLSKEKAGELVPKYYDLLRKGKLEEAKKLNRLYSELLESDTGISDPMIEKQLQEEMYSDFERLGLQGETSAKAAANYARVKKILEKQ